MLPARGRQARIQSDARVLAATNRNLEQSVTSGKIPGGPILPPGRCSREGATAAGAGGRHRAGGKGFFGELRLEHAKPALTFGPDALRSLSLRWPGNVRELQNRVRRAVIMADGKRVTAEDLELTDALSAAPPQT